MFQCSVLLKLEPVCEEEVRERGQWRQWAVEGFLFPYVTQPTPAADHMSSFLHLLALDTCSSTLTQNLVIVEFIKAKEPQDRGE